MDGFVPIGVLGFGVGMICRGLVLICGAFGVGEG